MSPSVTRSNALDHVLVVLFENRSFDNMLGHLYGPEDGKTFEGVIREGSGQSDPEWAEHGAGRKVVPYTVATDMDSPNPDSGEEWYHTNTQLFNTIDEHNRFKIGEGVTEPWNLPAAGATPTMDGFVTDYISTFAGEVGRQPTYEEYAHIMTGYTPEQVPVLSAIARDFGVFDHWFSEVPSQTFMNRSFWTAATSSGLVVNNPARKWFTENDAETIFERLEQHGKTWKVYVETMPLSFHGVIHFSRLQERLATHFVPFAEFERDAAAGTLPDFSLIEPNMLTGHSDYHPAAGRSFLGDNKDLAIDSPSSVLGGEAFLERVYNAYRSARSETGTNVWNTALLIGWDEPGGTYDHVPRDRCRRPTPPHPQASWASRSTARATAFPPSSSHRGSSPAPSTTTSTATPRSSQHCGRRGASAHPSPSGTPPRAPSTTSSRARPRGIPTPGQPSKPSPSPTGRSTTTWSTRPSAASARQSGRASSSTPENGGVKNLPPELDDPDTPLTSRLIIQVLRNVAWHYFPRLAPEGESH